MAARLTDQQKALRAISEAEWQKTVTVLLTAFGWRWWHAPDNRPVKGRVQRVRPGLPDLIAVRGDRVIFAELKRETGKPTPEQVDALAALGEATEAYLWRPSDIDEVRRVLMPGWGNPRKHSANSAS